MCLVNPESEQRHSGVRGRNLVTVLPCLAYLYFAAQLYVLYLQYCAYNTILPVLYNTQHVQLQGFVLQRIRACVSRPFSSVLLFEGCLGRSHSPSPRSGPVPC